MSVAKERLEAISRTLDYERKQPFVLEDHPVDEIRTIRVRAVQWERCLEEGTDSE